MLSKICIQCEKIFFKRPTKSKKLWFSQVKFCSKACQLNSPLHKQWLYVAQHMPKRRGFNKNGDFKKCLVCQKEFYIPKYRLNSANFCSISCSKSGKNHPCWKGGITPENNRARQKFYHSVRKQIFERDNYTCQICGIRGVDLQVDHIQPWADYVELRFSMDNCRTLCAKCHYFITFGREMPIKVKGWGHNLLRRVES